MVRTSIKAPALHRVRWDPDQPIRLILPRIHISRGKTHGGTDSPWLLCAEVAAVRACFLAPQRSSPSWSGRSMLFLSIPETYQWIIFPFNIAKSFNPGVTKTNVHSGEADTGNTSTHLVESKGWSCGIDRIMAPKDVHMVVPVTSRGTLCHVR